MVVSRESCIIRLVVLCRTLEYRDVIIVIRTHPSAFSEDYTIQSQHRGILYKRTQTTASHPAQLKYIMRTCKCTNRTPIFSTPIPLSSLIHQLSLTLKHLTDTDTRQLHQAISTTGTQHSSLSLHSFVLTRTCTILPHTERPPRLPVPHMDPGPYLLHTRPFRATVETAGDDLSGYCCYRILPST